VCFQYPRRIHISAATSSAGVLIWRCVHVCLFSFHAALFRTTNLFSPVISILATSHICFNLLTKRLVTIRLHPIGNAPNLKQRIFKLSTTTTFGTIVRFLRKRLGVKDHEGVYCYIGNVFSPSLDEGVGNLWSVSIVPSTLLRIDIRWLLCGTAL
jgi:hypothetical protein